MTSHGRSPSDRVSLKEGCATTLTLFDALDAGRDPMFIKRRLRFDQTRSGILGEVGAGLNVVHQKQLRAHC